MLVLTCSLRAADLPAPVTLDFPLAANKALPTWLGQPTIPPSIFAVLDLPIQAPDETSSLLVTVYFREKQDGFMRVTWAGIQGPLVLSNNFYENIGMANQRSLLISPATLAGNGSLNFQCGDATLGIKRIKLEWLTSKDGLVSSQVQDTLVTPAVGPTQPATILEGQDVPTEPGAWQNLLVTVPITDSAERIEEGVDFSIDLDQAPGAARLALQETGLPLGKHLVVWVNEQRAGSITPSVPDLLDGGYLPDAKSNASYVGWRNGSFYVPVSLLKAGINTLQFSTEDDANLGTTPTTPTTGDDTPLAIKNVTMQLDYTPSATPTATAPAPLPSFLVTQPSLNISDSTGPIPPADTSSTPSDPITP